MEPNKKKKILILCTGNSCRSQMAEGFAKEAGWESYSAGTKPEIETNPFAIKVMAELGIDISYHTPQSLNEYLDEKFFLIATVCDNAKENCPIFIGICEHQIHCGFEDPADTTGSEKKITEVYRKVRDEIRVWMDTICGDYLNN